MDRRRSPLARPLFLGALLLGAPSLSTLAAHAGRASLADDGALEGALSRAELEELARGSLFRLHVRDPRSKDARTRDEIPCLRVQPGFLIGEEGLAITRAAALEGVTNFKGNALQVEFLDRPGGHTVELLHIDPALDLALLQIRALPPRGKASEASQVEGQDGEAPAPALRGLELAAQGEVEGCEPAFALSLEGLPSPSGFRVAVVEMDRAFASGASSGLLGLQGTCVGGSPLVDVAGRLVGVTRWSWPDAEAEAEAPIGAGELASFCGSPPSTRARSTISPGGFPLIGWERAPGDASSLRGRFGAQTGKLAKDLHCDNCQGVGWKPTRKDRDGFWRIEITHRWAACNYCKNEGLKGRERLWTTFRQLAASVVPFATTAPKEFEAARATLAGSLTAALSINPSGLVEALESHASSALHASEPTLGAAVAFVFLPTDLEEAEAFDVPGLRAYRVPGGRLPEVLLLGLSPQRLEPHQFLFVLGVVAGAAPGPQGRTLTVVDGCVAISITLPRE